MTTKVKTGRSRMLISFSPFAKTLSIGLYSDFSTANPGFIILKKKKATKLKHQVKQTKRI